MPGRAARHTPPVSHGFSRKLEKHEPAVALNDFVHTFIRIHRTLRMSSAMGAGVTTTLSDALDLVNLLVEAEADKKEALVTDIVA